MVVGSLVTTFEVGLKSTRRETMFASKINYFYLDISRMMEALTLNSMK